MQTATTVPLPVFFLPGQGASSGDVGGPFSGDDERQSTRVRILCSGLFCSDGVSVQNPRPFCKNRTEFWILCSRTTSNHPFQSRIQCHPPLRDSIHPFQSNPIDQSTTRARENHRFYVVSQTRLRRRKKEMRLPSLSGLGIGKRTGGAN